MSSTKPRSADLHPGPGFRVRQNSPRLESVLVERFSDFDVPDISDTLNRLYALDSAIRCQGHPLPEFEAVSLVRTGLHGPRVSRRQLDGPQSARCGSAR